jgi:hypothetical protein
MPPIIGTRTREQLARSLHLLEVHKDRFLEGMEESLRAQESGGEGFGEAEVAAMILTELLLEQGRSLADRGELRLAGDALAQHRALAINGRHYSRFGDALVAVLRDSLGTGVPAEIGSAWCDAFWATVRAVLAQEERVTA